MFKTLIGAGVTKITCYATPTGWQVSASIDGVGWRVGLGSTIDEAWAKMEKQFPKTLEDLL